MARIIDLSREIKYNSKEPFFMRIKIKHKAHKKSKNLIRFLIKLPFSLFPKNFIGWADDTIEKMGVHSSTHLDAPWHYSPTVGEQAAKTVDEIPLEWCYGDGIVIDMSHKKDFEIIGVEDIKSALEKIGKDIEPGNIVLIRTDRDRYMGEQRVCRTWNRNEPRSNGMDNRQGCKGNGNRPVGMGPAAFLFCQRS